MGAQAAWLQSGVIDSMQHRAMPINDGFDSGEDVLAAAGSLRAMRLDLQQMRARREELRVALTKFDSSAVMSTERIPDQCDLAECSIELLEILAATDSDLDIEEQECLADLAGALLADRDS